MWQWMIDQKLIEGEASAYEEGSLSGEDYAHAVDVAYRTADDEQRKSLVDQLWETGNFQGDKTEWYTDRSGDEAWMTSLKGAATGMGAEGGRSDGGELVLPGNAQLWLNNETGEYWVVYEVPGITLEDGTSSDAIFTGWRIESDEDLEAIVGVDKTADPHFTGNNAAFAREGMIDLGGSDELLLEDLEGDPFDTWVEDMTTLAEVQPWILEEDYVQLVVQAAMERADGQVSLEEIQGTTWWKDHNAGERAWMETFHSDPMTAEQTIESNRDALRYRLSQSGVNNASDELIAFMADRTTMGSWNSQKLDAQVMAVADPWSTDVIDDELYEFMANEQWQPDATQKYEDRVRDNLRKWLGPVYGQWSDEDIAAKAGEFRNDPDAEINFIESLKDQRMAMYPNHGDRELSYEAIATPWRQFSQNMWGAPVDDQDDVFQNVLRMNDPEEASKLLRKTGLTRGYDKTVNEVIGGVKTAMKSNVRGAV